MSRRSRAAAPRDKRARHLSDPPAIRLADSLNGQPPPPRPNPIAVATRTPEEILEHEAELERERAGKLWMSIAVAQPQRYVPAVPIAELRAWMLKNAPKTWERMQSPPKVKA